MAISTNYLRSILGDDEGARLAIREFPHFQCASDRLLDLIFTYGRMAIVNAGQDLITEGEFDQWVYFILGGEIEVWVGGGLVDRITSSMVGERCILGEPRGATLRAGASGITALAVDMALLDALQHGDDAAADANVAVELLTVIAGEVIHRVADLIYNEIEVTAKQAVLLTVERTAGIIESLRDGVFAGDAKFNLEIYKYLRRKAPRLLPAFSRGGSIEVDTRALYVYCIESGQHDLLYDLAGQLAESLAGRVHNGFAFRQFPGPTRRKPMTFPTFARAIEVQEARALEKRGGNGRVEAFRRVWARGFRLDSGLSVNLARLCGALRARAGYSDPDLIELLRLLLRVAAEHTARINAGIQEKLSALAGVSLGKTLLRAGDTPLTVEAYTSQPIEALVPAIGRQVIYVRLVNPYLEQMAAHGSTAKGAAESASTELIESLFD